MALSEGDKWHILLQRITKLKEEIDKLIKEKDYWHKAADLLAEEKHELVLENQNLKLDIAGFRSSEID